MYDDITYRLKQLSEEENSINKKLTSLTLKYKELTSKHSRLMNRKEQN